MQNKQGDELPATATLAQQPSCAPPDSNPSRPRIKSPRGTCECHSHIFGPVSRFPYGRQRSYTPPEAPLEMYLALHDTLGIDRGVLVQGSVYGTDNSAMLAALKRAPTRLRGVAVIDREFSITDLRSMSELGVRGARFNHFLIKGKPVFKGGVGIDDFLYMHDSLADLGWHLQLWIHCVDLPDVWPSLSRCRVPIVIDHMGRIDALKGLPYPGFDFLLRLLADGKIWVKLSGIYRGTDNWPAYPEAQQFHNALVAANPDQCVWGLDWPHPALKASMPNDGALLDLFNEWTPDANLRKRILVKNPALLYDF